LSPLSKTEKFKSSFPSLFFLHFLVKRPNVCPEELITAGTILVVLVTLFITYLYFENHVM
ncbi:MAG TPA: hypothetical protein VF540_04395, partial [Segetibacter sp.]